MRPTTRWRRRPPSAVVPVSQNAPSSLAMSYRALVSGLVTLPVGTSPAAPTLRDIPCWRYFSTIAAWQVAHCASASA
jgi:hypothetical protein